MSQSEILIRILLTVVFGAILGLETETREIETKGKHAAEKEEKLRIGGLRTYTVISLIGGIAGVLYNQKEFPLVYITFGAIIALVLIAYAMNIKLMQAFGVTTEIAILISFLLGFLTTSGLVDIIIILVILVILTFFLSQKRGFGYFIHKIQHKEIIDVLKFGLITVVLLPILPNESFKVLDLINFLNIDSSIISDERIKNISIGNPFTIWIVVVVITGVNLGGYVLSRMFGDKKSILITSAVGGLISSTSATIAYATKAKAERTKSHETSLAGGAIIANAMSFVTVFFVISTVSNNLIKELWPSLVAMLLFGIAFGGYLIFITKDKTKHHHVVIQNSNFQLLPAVKFVSMIVVITIVVQFVQLSNNDSAVTLVTAISGVIGIDAPAIAVGGLVHNSIVTIDQGAQIILLANAINFLAKIFYAYLYGTKDFTFKLLLGLTLSAMVSLVYFVV